ETALNVLLDAHPRLGETVVVFGQGVVGLLVTLLLRRAGAGTVVTVDRWPPRRDLSRRLWADCALEPGDEVVEQVHELTDSAGADLAIEVSGAGEALAAALECVAFQG